jgi:uncharacterized membrane protein YhiD involved in acid resistance
VRDRAKVEDPKDAGVMLATLAVGLASGVGFWLVALTGTAFLLALLTQSNRSSRPSRGSSPSRSRRRICRR